MKYVVLVLATLAVSLGITVWYLQGQLETCNLKLSVEKSNSLQLQNALATQNEAIKNLQLESESFKEQYESLISKKQEALEPVKSIQVNSCKDILSLIEALN